MPRLCPGGTVVCLASGPSLTTEDVEFIRGKATVIAINDAVRLAPWADVLYSSDAIWWSRQKGMPKFPGLRARVSASRNRLTFAHPGVLMLKNTGERGIDFTPDALRTAKNSGGAAINLAVHLGAKLIVLIGYDMGPKDGRHHFFDQGPVSHSSPYESFRKLIGTMAEPLRSAGIEVVNCSRETRLDCFPRKPLVETLAVVAA